ncbi:protein of unknown function [Vibrio tapetis subsp. tapetis]|uniref:Uncharacterized protein n=1 Tax=Vibrio tapetis subsp. tapetis TaxID=1671868 RepID=A0A2N8ZHX1_9VIBR|nr:protein of unknown function [Vibrio tapetis subsp. tapetis]
MPIIIHRSHLPLEDGAGAESRVQLNVIAHLSVILGKNMKRIRVRTFRGTTPNRRLCARSKLSKVEKALLQTNCFDKKIVL